jgi:hypothetical protein
MKIPYLDVVYVATLCIADKKLEDLESFKGVYSTKSDAYQACVEVIMDLKKKVTLHKIVDSELEVCYKLCDFEKVIELWNNSTDYKFKIFKGPGL